MTQLYTALLANRGAVRVAGTDRQAFLQGLISNDIRLVASGRAIFAALLTPQGKFLHDLFIAEDGDSYLIDCEAARADNLLQRLGKYKLRAKVMLENASNGFDVWTAWGNSTDTSSPLTLPIATRWAPSLSPQRGERVRAQRAGEGGVEFIDPRLSELGFRIFLKKNKTPENFQRADFAAYDEHRLRLGATDGSRDMLIEKSTLPEGNFDFLNGISWDKGCYMGQELTARLHYRGLTKKRLFPVAIEGVAPVPGTVIHFNNEDIGEMRSSCGNRGLALLNVEKAKVAIGKSAQLAGGASRLTPSKPEWMKLK